jgi:hypothetical protein
MIILTGRTGASVRRAPPLVAGHGPDAGRVMTKIPPTPAQSIWPLRKVPAAGGSFLLEGFTAAGLTSQEGKAADKLAKSALCALHPVGKVLAEGVEALRSSREVFSGFQDHDRHWSAKVQDGFEAVDNVMDLITAALPQIKEHRVVRILEQSVTLGGEVLKIVELAATEEPSAQRLL